MTLFDLAEMIDTNIVVQWHPNWDNCKWSATLRSCEVKGGGMLSSLSGKGETVDDALRDYRDRIKGETLVYMAMSEKFRAIYNVPKDLN